MTTTALADPSLAEAIARELLACRSNEESGTLRDLTIKAFFRMKENGKLPCSAQAAVLLFASDIAVQHPLAFLSLDAQNDLCIGLDFDQALAWSIRCACGAVGMQCSITDILEYSRRPALPAELFKKHPDLSGALCAIRPDLDPNSLCRRILLNCEARQNLCSLFLSAPSEDEARAVQAFLAQGVRGAYPNELFGPACSALAALAEEDSPKGAFARHWLSALHQTPWGGDHARSLLSHGHSLYERQGLRCAAKPGASPKKPPGL